MKKFIVFGLLLFIAGFGLSGCFREAGKAGDDSTPQTAAFDLEIFSLAHDTTLWINDEPAAWASPSASIAQDRSFIINGFPIRHGKNSYSITVSADYPPDYKIPRFGNPDIYMLSSVQESDDGVIRPARWLRVDEFRDKFPETNDIVWDSSFEIKATISDPGLDLLGASTNVLSEQARLFSVELAKLLKNQDAEGFAGALSLTNKENVQNFIGPKGLTNFVYGSEDLTNLDYSVCVSNAADVEIEIGSRIMLAHSRDGGHLAEWTYENGRSRRTVFLDCLGFARLQGKWKVSLPGSQFFDLGLKENPGDLGPK